MNKILITGSSKGIGLSVARYFLAKGYEVYGLDLLESSIDDINYHHYICDISKPETLPEIDGINYLFNNAGKQNSDDDITNNLKGTINVTREYAYDNDQLISILFNASSSASTGFEFDEYAASKAGIVNYMKHTAHKLAGQGVIVNSISLGGVLTDSNKEVIEDSELWNKIMDVTPLKKWMSLDEVNEWVYFLLVKNKSMSGEDILIDNGEKNLNCTFVWPNF